MDIKENFSVKELNTFGIDAKVRYFAEAENIEQIKELYNEYLGLPKMILGGGSNILFSKDFDGLLIRNLVKGINKVQEDSDFVLIEAGAGEVWDNFVNYCIDNNYGGLENLSLIPGTVGASPIQNIGAYGVEIKDVFEQLRGYNVETGDILIYAKGECHFGYRDSIFKKELKDKFVITSVTFKLSKDPVVNIKYEALKTEFQNNGTINPTIKQVSEVVCRVRMSKLPDPKVIGNAGSFFKNPEITFEQFESLCKKHNDIPGYNTESGKVKIPAGWLIQKCGWRGKRIGNIGVYDKQALVLVNYGGAKGREIVLLSEKIKESISSEFGIMLETEVNII